jgi:lipopolysaccharide/colanic/teichoic acid biosynthesis glycosyltransferase
LNSSKESRVFDNFFGFYSEEYFREMLIMERKRSERSKKPFLLVMIDIDQMCKAIRDSQFTRMIQHFLQGSSREIDVKGWYERHHTIGIIYTEISMDGKDAILHKIQENMEMVFGQEQAAEVKVSCAVFPEEKKEADSEADVADPRFYPYPSDRFAPKRTSLAFKRGIDIMGSLVLIFLLAPFFIFIPLIIKLTSKGPVFFTQKRIGQAGRLFTFIKFRSMRVQKDCSIHKEFMKNFVKNQASQSAAGQPSVFKIKNDPRVTPIGKFIRKTSIDELPQLFNVLTGEMSLVGPRPAIPYEIEEYDTWHRNRVLEVKPGITGFWQVKGRSKTNFETMVRMDLQYIQRWSLLWDIRLIIQTPFALFKGAY